MMRKYLIILCAAVVAFSACRRSSITPEEARENSLVPVTFTVSGTGFTEQSATAETPEANAEAGVFALDPINCVNLLGMVSGNKLITVQKIYWQWLQEESTHFLAYIPYSDQITDRHFSFEVQKDQSAGDGENLALSDLRIASATARPETTVNLNFRHVLSKLVVEASCQDPADKVVSVKTGAVITGVKVNLAGAALTAETQRGAITALPKGGTFTAILVPQTSDFPLELVTEKGTKFQATLAQPAEFQSGYAYKASIVVPREGGKTTFTLSLTDWGDGGSLPFTQTYEN